MLCARLEQERVVGKHRHRFVEARTVCGRHRVVVVAADAVDAGDVAHQLARGDRPLLLGVCRNIPLNGRIEIEAPPVVQKGGGQPRSAVSRGRRDGSA